MSPYMTIFCSIADMYIYIYTCTWYFKVILQTNFLWMHPDDSYGDVRPVDTQDIGRSVSLVKFSLSAGISHGLFWMKHDKRNSLKCNINGLYLNWKNPSGYLSYNTPYQLGTNFGLCCGLISIVFYTNGHEHHNLTHIHLKTHLFVLSTAATDTLAPSHLYPQCWINI